MYGLSMRESQVPILEYLFQRPHTAICVSSYYYICVRILLYVSSSYSMCPHTTIRVLILLYMCPHTTTDVSSYYYLSSVLILLHMCPDTHTTAVRPVDARVRSRVFPKLNNLRGVPIRANVAARELRAVLRPRDRRVAHDCKGH